MSQSKTRIVIEGKNNSKRAFKEVSRDLDGMSSKMRSVGKLLVASFSLAAFQGAVRSITSTADAYNLMSARLKLATDTQGEFNRAQSELKRIATEVETPLESLITLYSRISPAMREAGRTQQDILDITEAVSRSFRISGATATEAENGVIQFAQALGAGALRGDEFNSVAEQAPRLMKALADGLGVPISALREMARQGQLTADIVTDSLVDQLDTLRSESADLPRTVGGAMTALTNEWNEAIAQTDLTPLIDSLSELTKAVSDPALRENLVSLTNILITLSGWAVTSASELLDLSNRIYEIARSASGFSSELEDVEGRISDIDRALASSGLKSTIDRLVYSDEELQAEKAALEERKKILLEGLAGANQEAQALAERANEEVAKARKEDVQNFNEYVSELKTIQDDQIKAVDSALKKQVNAEKKAQAEIEKVRQKRLDIEKRYADALAGLGGTGEASYAQAQDLKLSARRALSNGDIESSQSYAQQALAVLQELAEAGENTYGFEGFIKELRGIELAANDLESTKAEEKLLAIRENVKALEEQAAALKETPVSFKMDDAKLAEVRKQILDLAAELKQELILPVAVSSPTTSSETVPGFATGGAIRGPGTGTSDSILARLSNGEYVIKAAAVRKYGTNMLDRLNGMRLPKYADGGLVGNIQPASSGTPLNLTLDGQTFSLSGDSGTIEDLARVVRSARLKRR